MQKKTVEMSQAEYKRFLAFKKADRINCCINFEVTSKRHT
jgi:hypothetical protein